MGEVSHNSTSNTSARRSRYSDLMAGYHLLLFRVLVAAGDPLSLTLGLSVFNPSSTPFISAALTVLTSATPSTTFPGSAAPTTGISDASHCWNGLATKYPSAENHLVKGAESSIVCHVVLFASPLRADGVRWRTVRL